MSLCKKCGMENALSTDVKCWNCGQPLSNDMTTERETLLLIKGAISELPAAQREACNELIDHINRVILVAGEPVGSLALAFVGAEKQLKP